MSSWHNTIMGTEVNELKKAAVMVMVYAYKRLLMERIIKTRGCWRRRSIFLAASLMLGGKGEAMSWLSLAASPSSAYYGCPFMERRKSSRSWGACKHVAWLPGPCPML